MQLLGNLVSRKAENKLDKARLQPFVHFPVNADRGMSVTVADALAAQLERNAVDVANQVPFGPEGPVSAMHDEHNEHSSASVTFAQDLLPISQAMKIKAEEWLLSQRAS